MKSEQIGLVSNQVVQRPNFRFLLPVVAFCIWLPLFLWEGHNQRVIQEVGMGWDTGAPLWTYRTPEEFMVAINLPAYLFTLPIWRSSATGLYPWRDLITLPFIVIWWYLVGKRVDHGLVPHWCIRHRRMSTAIMMSVFLALVCIPYVLAGNFQWWFEYHSDGLPCSLLFIVVDIGAVCWSLVLVAMTGVAAIRLIRDK